MQSDRVCVDSKAIDGSGQRSTPIVAVPSVQSRHCFGFIALECQKHSKIEESNNSASNNNASNNSSESPCQKRNSHQSAVQNVSDRNADFFCFAQELHGSINLIDAKHCVHDGFHHE